MINAILFDLYDTLVWPDWTALQAGRDALAAQLGLEAALAREQWRATHRDRMLGAHGGLEGDLAAIFAGCNRSPDAAVLRDLAAREFANWARGVHLYADTLPTLRRLRAAGYRTAIVSNASCEAVSVLEGLELDGAVDTVVASCDVGALKPEPAILRIALDRLHTTPERALLVDDMVANLDAARSLGLRTALVARTGPSAATDHPCITDLDALWPLLESQEATERHAQPRESRRRTDEPTPPR